MNTYIDSKILKYKLILVFIHKTEREILEMLVNYNNFFHIILIDHNAPYMFVEPEFMGLR